MPSGKAQRLKRHPLSMPAGSSLNSAPQAPDSAHLAQPWFLRSISQVRNLPLRGQKLSRRPRWLRQDSSPDLADLSQSRFPGVVGPLPSPVGKVQAQPHQWDSRPVWRLDLCATKGDGVRTMQWYEIENPGERIKFLSTGLHVLGWWFLKPHSLFPSLQLGWLSPFC